LIYFINGVKSWEDQIFLECVLSMTNHLIDVIYRKLHLHPARGIRNATLIPIAKIAAITKRGRMAVITEGSEVIM